MEMANLLINELERIFLRKKTTILLFIVVLVTLFDSLFVNYFDKVVYNSQGASAPLSRLNFSVAVGKELFFLLHFLVFPIFFIDSFSEVSSGTYRFTMIKPISRIRLLFSKWGTQIILLGLTLTIVLLLSYIYGWLFIGTNDYTFFLKNSIRYDPFEAFVFTMKFYGVFFVISVCVLMISSFIALFFNPILSYILTIGLMVATVYVGNEFVFFLLPGEEALKILSEQNNAFFILTLVVIAVGLIVNMYVWRRKDFFH